MISDLSKSTHDIAALFFYFYHREIFDWWSGVDDEIDGEDDDDDDENDDDDDDENDEDEYDDFGDGSSCLLPAS